jgi:spore photoproduct lyase
LPGTIAAAKYKDWTKYLTESSNWGKKTDIELRFKLLSVAITTLRENGISKIAVWKDTLAMWRRLKEQFGMDYQDMPCNYLP